MAVKIFFAGRYFRERFVQRSEKEYRIVSEAAGAARRLQNRAIHAITDDRQDVSFSRYGQRADKVCLTFIAISL